MQKLLILAITLSVALSWATIENEEHFGLFKSFTEQFGKIYHTEQELLKRFNIFRNNIKNIFHHKMQDKTADYGVTPFSDMTPEEFEAQILTMNLEQNIRLGDGHQNNHSKIPYSQYDVSKLPQSFDWRKKNVITRVKQQSTCGSCWTFATTGVIEAQYAIKTGQLVEFSEQMLLDCDNRNDGCSGGLMHKAYKSIRDWGGLEFANTYGGYKNSKQSCHKNKENFAATVTNYFMSEQNESYIMHYIVNHGPMAAGVNAKFLQFYKSGVHSHMSCNNNINHAIMIVGYGTENGTDYWIIKNTWGSAWGEQGYFKLLRGEQHCGIHTYVSGPHVEVLQN